MIPEIKIIIDVVLITVFIPFSIYTIIRIALQLRITYKQIRELIKEYKRLKDEDNTEKITPKQ